MINSATRVPAWLQPSDTPQSTQGTKTFKNKQDGSIHQSKASSLYREENTFLRAPPIPQSPTIVVAIDLARLRSQEGSIIDVNQELSSL